MVGALAVGAIWRWAPQPEPAGATRIAVVQPGVVEGPNSVELRFARSEQLTRTLVGRQLDLVVWGESSVGEDLSRRPDLAARIAKLSREVGADVLVNMDARQTGASGRTGIFKSAVLVGRTARPGTATTKCVWCRSASTFRLVRCSAG